MSASSGDFRPIFVVGCQRSGTTALAVMFDRHSRIAALPETQFFRRFAAVQKSLKTDAPARIQAALEDSEIAKAGLSVEEVTEALAARPPTLPNLFRSLLEAYARRHRKARPLEKSCHHLFAAETILEHYPEARIICIVRDGRAVVQSLRRSRISSSLPDVVHCIQWNHFAREALRLQQCLPAASFTLVRFESLMTDPVAELTRLCHFVGENFEPGQLKAAVSSAVIPEDEVEWKSKAATAPDASRIHAWRTAGSPMELARMTHHMAPYLEKLGYPDAAVQGVKWWRRWAWRLEALPLRSPLFPFTQWAFRSLRNAVRRSKGEPPVLPGQALR